MPELAEVELARRIWEPGLGKRVLTIETHPRTRVFRDSPADEVTQALSHRTMLGSRTHGKRLLFSFGSPTEHPSSTDAPGGTLHLELHLGMAGRLLVSEPGYEAAKHDHLLLRTQDLCLVYSDYRQFGRVLLHEEKADPWRDLPIEVLDRRFTRAYLEALTQRRSGTALKALLLDQAVFPGIGNWMADEICWRLGVHPASKVGDLDLHQIRRTSREVCRGALRHVADKNTPISEAEGFSPGRYVQRVPPRSWLFQHRWRSGGTCPRCRSELARSTVATRTSAWCPICQPEVRSET